MEKKPNPTLQDIADKCGVSKMTVSLALRGDPRVKASTAKGIWKTAQRMGYRTNPYVSALMAQLRFGRRRTDRPVIAFLNPQEDPRTFRATSAGRGYIEGARARAKELGFRLEQFNTADPDRSVERLDRIFFTRNIHAVLLGPASARNSRIEMDWRRYAVAKFGFTIDYPKCHYVTSDHFQSMQLLVNNLVDRGYRRIGLALPHSMHERVDHRWVGSFLYQQWRLGESGSCIVFVPERERWCRESFLRWYERERPEAVVSYEPRIPEWLESGGYSIPGDVAFATVDWSRSSPEFSGVNPRPRRTGALAVELVVEQIHRNEWGEPPEAKCVLVPGEWVEGRTVAAGS